MNLVLFESHIPSKVIQNVSKVVFLQTWWSSLSGAKKFLLGTTVTNNTSLASVELYLSIKAIGMITRSLKRILRSQTSAACDFLNLVLFESHISSKVIQNVSKAVFLQT